MSPGVLVVFANSTSGFILLLQQVAAWKAGVAVGGG